MDGNYTILLSNLVLTPSQIDHYLARSHDLTFSGSRGDRVRARSLNMTVLVGCQKLILLSKHMVSSCPVMTLPFLLNTVKGIDMPTRFRAERWICWRKLVQRNGRVVVLQAAGQA